MFAIGAFDARASAAAAASTSGARCTPRRSATRDASAPLHRRAPAPGAARLAGPPRARRAVLARAQRPNVGSNRDVPDDDESKRRRRRDVDATDASSSSSARSSGLGASPRATRDAAADADANLDLDPSSSIDPDLDVIPEGPPEEDEAFALKKKRFELVIEEKEWMLESSAGEDKMTSIVEYVNAVEAYKELCSSQVPNTVSDLLSQYVKVFVVHPTAKGYDEAFDFLCMSDEGDDDDDEAPARSRGFSRGGGDAALDIDEVDKIIRALAMDDDDSDDEDEDDLEDEAWRLLRGVAKEGPAPMHCAQDVEGRWRWLEDDLGRPLERKPDCDFVVKLMSVEEMVQSGLNVNSLHEEVDPAELVDFSGCKSWDDAIRVGREVEAALEHMRADGWEVDTRSWCNDADALMVVKELSPLRTMSYVEGRAAKRERGSKGGKKKAAKNASEGDAEPAPRTLRGDNNVVNNASADEKKRDGESFAA